MIPVFWYCFAISSLYNMEKTLQLTVEIVEYVVNIRAINLILFFWRNLEIVCQLQGELNFLASKFSLCTE